MRFRRARRSGRMQELTASQIDELNERFRAQQLRADPSDIPGMTQRELNEVIDTGTIDSGLLRAILNH